MENLQKVERQELEDVEGGQECRCPFPEPTPTPTPTPTPPPKQAL